MTLKPDIEFRVGRRMPDGEIKLSALTPQILQLTVSHKGERASSVVLTRTQVQTLRLALAEFELSMETDDRRPEKWDGNERRLE
jgi:hypothetical protein